MKNKALLIIGSLIVLGIVVILIGRQFGWMGGIKPIEVQIISIKNSYTKTNI